MSKHYECCELKSVFGRNLHDCVMFVSIATIVLSVIIFVTACTSLIFVLAHKETAPLPKYPVVAVNIIFGLVAACISCYQIIVSSLLLWEVCYMKGDEFVCSTWYVSHLTIIPIYFVLFFIKGTVCLANERHLTGILTFTAGIVYEFIIIYSCLIVNSFLISLERAGRSMSNMQLN